MVIEYLADMLEKMVLVLMHFVWDSMSWHVKVLFVLFLIFVTWWFSKTMYWVGNRIHANFSEFVRDVKWTAGKIRDAAVWMKRTVSRLYWRMVEAHVDRLMTERGRLRSPSPRRGTVSSLRLGRLRSPSPRLVRFSPAGDN